MTKEKKENENDERCSKKTLVGGIATLAVGKSIIGLGVVLLIIFGFFKYYNVWAISDWTFIGMIIVIITALVISIIGTSITSVCGAKELDKLGFDMD